MSQEERNAPPSKMTGPIIVVLCAIVIVLLGLLATSINERRWEAQRPKQVVQPVGEWETDPMVWGANYPREYESWKRTEEDTTKTKFGGAFPRDYLDADPYQVVLFAGYGFSKDYRQARGHAHAAEDAWDTKRSGEKSPATCWTCKSPDVPRLMNEMGIAEFYASKFVDLKDKLLHPISCLDCHDPKTLKLKVSRPALREAFQSMGKDIEKATHQEMRSLACAQCHVEYYFKGEGNYLAFPWKKGTSVENMIDYYEEIQHVDYVHPVSRTKVIKAQHPDYEMYMTGIHAFRGVSCADCHMPYRSEGGVKYSDHQVRSPLLDVSTSCAVCHRWSEEDIRQRVEAIQTKVFNAKMQTEKVLVEAHFDVAAAMEAGATDEELAEVRKTLRHAQFRWDFVSANNGMGFHSPQESMRILGDATKQGQDVRLMAARILAAKGYTDLPLYPEVKERKSTFELMETFIKGEPPKLLPPKS